MLSMDSCPRKSELNFSKIEFPDQLLLIERAFSEIPFKKNHLLV